MTEAVHRHGALAGIELWHGGGSVMNRSSRVAPLSPSGTSWMATHVNFMGNQRPRAMDTRDIRALLNWQAEAARKARCAGFDIVYVYAGMGISAVRIPAVGLEPAHRCLRRQRAQSCAHRARAAGSHARGSGRPLRRRAADQSRGAAFAAQRSGALGSPRSRRAARRGCPICGT